tara:strand:+ start:13656 stop:14960 length:1305 start_codon:yes stop_codon:yes gene_type:complete
MKDLKILKKNFLLAKKKIFPLNRSITGNGTLNTLKIIKNKIPQLRIIKIKSNTNVFDWKVPPEWNISKAYILDKNKKKILDFKKNNLHIVGYSNPVNKFFSKRELFKRLHSLPNQANAIPYVTSYYKKYWGFCLTESQKKEIKKKYYDSDKFKVVIKSQFNKRGSLNYGELVIPGKSKQEILISTYICHPSMANNELSGPIVSMTLAQYFLKIKNLKKTLRFIFIPETIGSISYLSKNLKKLKKNVIAGYNLSCIGDERMHSCMFSKYSNSISDKALRSAYKSLNINYKRHSFLKRGSDERQFNSPGIDLPIASIFRTKYAEYPEYHTSLDDFKLVTIRGLMGGFKVAKKAINLILEQIYPKNKILCEPHMSKRKLYPTLSKKDTNYFSESIMDFLQYADGKNNINEISILIKKNLKFTINIYNLLLEKKLIEI